MRISRRTRHTHIVVTAAAIAIFAAACTESLRSLGPTPAAADAHADQIFNALADRFTNPDIAPRYDIARKRFGEAALVPSRAFNDSTVWAARPSASLRLFYASGSFDDGRYHLDARSSLVPPVHPGDTRHAISLEQLAPNAYRWDTRVDLALGTVTPEEISNFISVLFKSTDGRADAAVRLDYRAVLPRAAAAWGRGFSVDSLHLAPGGAGTTTVALTVGFHADAMRAAFPALAAYLDKYLGPAKFRLAFAEKSGLPLMDIVARDRAVTLHYRVDKNGLVSLAGPPRPWSDTLQLTIDATIKAKVFTVGFHDLVTDFTISNSGRERAWTVLAQREPHWDLPLITERLIRSPLRRPFEGPGAMFRMSVLDSAGEPTVFSRRTRLDLQESAIMRFFGGLASRVLGDIDTRVESDEDRFFREGFTALRSDLRAAAGTP